MERRGCDLLSASLVSSCMCMYFLFIHICVHILEYLEALEEQNIIMCNMDEMLMKANYQLPSRGITVQVG